MVYKHGQDIHCVWHLWRLKRINVNWVQITKVGIDKIRWLLFSYYVFPWPSDYLIFKWWSGPSTVFHRTNIKQMTTSVSGRVSILYIQFKVKSQCSLNVAGLKQPVNEIPNLSNGWSSSCMLGFAFCPHVENNCMIASFPYAKKFGSI